MNKNLLNSAASKLNLLDITLAGSGFFEDQNLDRFSLPSQETTEQQSGFQVNVAEVTYKGEDNSDISIFRVLVDLGARLVKKADNQDKEEKASNPHVFYEVKAGFRVDFLLVGEALTEDEKKEFSEFNAVHNVWPFWRQHVFSTLNMAKLPPLEVPLMQGWEVSQ